MKYSEVPFNSLQIVKDLTRTSRSKVFEEHLMACEGCEIYLDQVRTSIRVTGRLNEDSIPLEQLERLTSAFRSWKHA